MNENIKRALNQYLDNPDPQYALMIKGKWGCGKTFFVQNWMKIGEECSKDNVLKPIYVSLYGLKNTHEITTAINKVLYPRLYGKAAKVGKSLLKIVSGIVLHHEIDINGDKNSDFALDLPLDSLSILNSDDEQVKDDKFLIFDDIERCLVGMEELLGYINYFVEHCHCHVLLVGDETRIADEKKNTFDSFKEKTVGREMTLMPDTDSAIDAFAEGLGDFVKRHVPEIKKTFELSGCDNLRILRQCLWDFNQMEIQLEPEDGGRYEDVITSMLCCYVATYCEYKGQNKRLLSDWLQQSAKVNMFQNDELKKSREQLQELQNKYSACPTFTYYPVFYMPLVMPIIKFIETGEDLIAFAKEQTKPVSVRPSWERVSDAYVMSNEDFKVFYAELLNDICNGRILKAHDFGYVLVVICHWNEKDIISLSKKEIHDIKKSIGRFFDGVQTQEALLDKRRQLLEGWNFYITETETPLLKDILDTINVTFEKHLTLTQDSMTIVLENLTDGNCEALMDMDGAVIPDRSTSYNSVSIFNRVDITKVFKGLNSISNKGRQDFNSFIRKRYKLSYNIASSTCDLKDDIPALTELLALVKTKVSETEMMERESYNRIVHSLQGAINRCNGDLAAQ